ncbi:hypothetical protein [Asticcacaulis sp.]|uniref:hypothetical protein n=1 Tax=Asticcacaulis sp. TaxID=1872648 RepID=UPI00262B40FD|nr:hypothetical protein [Asticcacaulis sp.]
MDTSETKKVKVEPDYEKNKAKAIKVLKAWAEEHQLHKNILKRVLGDKPTDEDIATAPIAIVSAIELLRTADPRQFDLLVDVVSDHVKTARHLMSIEFSVADIEKLIDCAPLSPKMTRQQMHHMLVLHEEPETIEPSFVVAFTIASIGRVVCREVKASELRQFVSEYEMRETSRPDDNNFVFFAPDCRAPEVFPGGEAEKTATPHIYCVFKY